MPLNGTSMASPHETWTPPDGAVTVQPTRLTVPAGGTAAATVRVAADQLPVGKVYGRIRASAPDGVDLTTAIGATRENESYRLNVTGIGLDGSGPDPSNSAALAEGLHTGSAYYGTFDAAGAVHWTSLSDTGGGGRGQLPDTYRIVGVLGSTRLNHDVAFGGWTVQLDRDRQVRRRRPAGRRHRGPASGTPPWSPRDCWPASGSAAT